MSPDDLLAQLHHLDAALREDKRERWQRDLPFDELVFDRWERARSLGFGADSSVYHNAYVYGDVEIGESTWVGPFVLLDGVGGLTIGAHCSISAGVHIYTHDTVRWALSAGVEPRETAPVTIGDCTYIGSQAVITKGVTIGHQCVVGANSVVAADVESHSVVAGVPARRIGRVAVDADGAISLETGSER